MNASVKKADWPKIIFIIFVAAYALTMIIGASLGPVDDVVLLRTLQAGRPILYYAHGGGPYGYGDVTTFGRFTVMGIMEYNFFSFFSKSPSAFWYFAFHAFQYVLLMAILVVFISRFTSKKILIYGIPIVLSLFPSMTITFFRTHIMERNVIFYYLVFLYFYFLYVDKKKLWYLIFGVISATIAIHYKETAFIALGAFCFFHLILSWKESKRGLKIFDGLVLLSCLVYILLYYFIVVLHLPANAIIYGQVPYNPVLVLIKLLLNYGLFTDPIMILIVLPFTAWRVIQFFRKKIELHPVYDSMLLAACSYTLGYLALKMFSPSYLLPAYAFAIPPLIYFFSQKEARTIFWKVVAGIAGIALVFNVFPTGIHYITYFKYLSVNFNKTLDFLIEDINTKYPDKRANIFIDGVNQNINIGDAVYFIFEEFLQYKGLSWTRFDFKSSVETENKASDFISKLPFSVFQKNKASEISKGDYLLITPDSTTKNINKDYIDSLK